MDDITTKKREKKASVTVEIEQLLNQNTIAITTYKYLKKKKIEMNKKTGMDGDTFKKIIIKKKKKASSLVTVSLCSPEAKNTSEMSLLNLYKVLFF